MSIDRSLLLEGGPAGVLLIHGLGGTPVEMRQVARRLAAAGMTVLCCQLAGHGGSEDELAATSFEDWYASAEAALATLEARCAHVLVGGLSMGALLAALLAAREPQRVRALIMLAPTLRYDGWSIPRYSFLLRLLINTPLGRRYRFVEREPYGLKDERTRGIVARALRQGNGDAGILATPAQALRQLWRLVAALKPLLPQIRQPALIVHARQDDVASLDNAFFLQRRLGGPVESLVLEDSYHLVTLDRQHRLVTEKVVAFAQAIDAARVSPAARPSGSRRQTPELGEKAEVAHVA
ncbi:alpha/beta hydrolase [Roseixanthobacter pseudopolyaromaticivorans]|uniref:alpha/beta hydrolase n=1 Tax=Xanthobacteraceae TaxID=335928 RepID=UPI0037290BA0